MDSLLFDLRGGPTEVDNSQSEVRRGPIPLVLSLCSICKNGSCWCSARQSGIGHCKAAWGKWCEDSGWRSRSVAGSAGEIEREATLGQVAALVGVTSTEDVVAEDLPPCKFRWLLWRRVVRWQGMLAINMQIGCKEGAAVGTSCN